MKKLSSFIVLLSVFAVAPSYGQEQMLPTPLDQPAAGANTRPTVAPPRTWTGTVDQESGWGYIRRRAREKAESRQSRIEGMRWLGYSHQRPTTSATPMMSHPPTWPAGPSSFSSPVHLYWYHPVNLSSTGMLP